MYKKEKKGFKGQIKVLNERYPAIFLVSNDTNWWNSLRLILSIQNRIKIELQL